MKFKTGDGHMTMKFKTGDLVKVRHIHTNLFEEAVVVAAINHQYCLFFLKDGPVKYHWYDWYEAENLE